MIFSKNQERVRFLRFTVVGTIGAAVDFGVFNLLRSFLGIHALIASVISFSVAVTSNFIWNRLWTYPESRSKPISHQMTQFTIVNVIGLLIRTPIFAGLEPLMGKVFLNLPVSRSISSEFLGHNSALAIAIGVVMLWNFFINRYWTYNDIGLHDLSK